MGDARTLHQGVETIVCPLLETGPSNLRNSEASVIELKDGRLFLAYTHFYGGGGDADVSDVQGKISEDGGRTWSKPFTVQPNTARYSTGRVSWIRLKSFRDVHNWTHSDDVALTYSETNTCYENRVLFKYSHDEGRSWAREVQINQMGTLGDLMLLSDTALVLSSGRIVVPVSAMFGELCASYMYYSDDAGMSWRRSRGEIAVPIRQDGFWVASSWFVEPTVVELRDGRLLCFGRTFTGRIWQSFSNDQGITWSEAEPTDLASSGSPSILKTIPTTGDLLCVWNQASADEIGNGFGRMRVSCAISQDEGKTWGYFKNLESLDDRTRIDPPPIDLNELADTKSEATTIKVRVGLLDKGILAASDEFTSRYPRWPGYCWNYYPSVCFTHDGNVVFTYSVTDAGLTDLPVGLKLVVRSIEWLYESTG